VAVGASRVAPLRRGAVGAGGAGIARAAGLGHTGVARGALPRLAMPAAATR